MRDADGTARAKLMKFAPEDRATIVVRLPRLDRLRNASSFVDIAILRNANPEDAPDVAGAQLRGPSR